MRLIIITIITVIVFIAIYQTISYQSASVKDYTIYYYSLVKPILIPLRRILLVSLGVISIMFVILFITHSTPKKTLGALGILLFIAGNILLFLHTLL